MSEGATPGAETTGGTPEPSSTGLDPRLAGLLCYLLGFVTGLVFLVLEKTSADVRFHAYQSLGTFGALFVISVVANFLPIIGPLVGFLASLASLVLWIVLMVKAYQGERWKVPVIGDWAEQQAR